ncbi:sugar ABC transporter ATP-binding protein [Butyricicoccus faecihominis]|uniref:sugar ABC transporter ATP-binding protein n=1 Tax=Butyricicoccus faecihominis TaxID=1712515 RepID=UPI0024792C06|nr:sugar ABC transporter ATP-binding protein [Butyricicoccus faecihominis]MCQ5130126.1 sugar ABC transporter ATP-binding protein [Butyricicoccus faecihominis]
MDDRTAKMPIMSTQDLTKKFGKFVANKEISLDVYKGEILAIIGENGAGKSTFCKMITGNYAPSSGKIILNGKEVHLKSVAQSLKAGIAMVYQERNLIGGLTGAQNICFGQEPQTRALMNEKKMLKCAEEIRNKLGIHIELNTPVESMSAGDKQQIEILRALKYNPKILILDEPTASLGKSEVDPFFKFIKRLCKAEDIAIIFISHKLDEVFSLSDRIAVFTDGKLVKVSMTAETTQEECISAMLRDSKIKPVVVKEKDISKEENVLEITEDIFYDDRAHHIPIRVKRGEVVGMYGLVGSGRTESLEAIYGLRHTDFMKYKFNGEEIRKTTSKEMIERGMVLTPELRANAIFADFDLIENISYLFYSHRLSKPPFGAIENRKKVELVDRVLQKNNVKFSAKGQKIVELSGGNMQKIIIGRSTEVSNICLLALDEPTNGMDIGAKYEVYHEIRRLADEDNVAVIFISSELDELLSVTDRLYVYYNGDIIQEVERKAFDKAAILNAAVRG